MPQPWHGSEGFPPKPEGGLLKNSGNGTSADSMADSGTARPGSKTDGLKGGTSAKASAQVTIGRKTPSHGDLVAAAAAAAASAGAAAESMTEAVSADKKDSAKLKRSVSFRPTLAATAEEGLGNGKAHQGRLPGQCRHEQGQEQPTAADVGGGKRARSLGDNTAADMNSGSQGPGRANEVVHRGGSQGSGAHTGSHIVRSLRVGLSRSRESIHVSPGNGEGGEEAQATEELRGEGRGRGEGGGGGGGFSVEAQENKSRRSYKMSKGTKASLYAKSAGNIVGGAHASERFLKSMSKKITGLGYDPDEEDDFFGRRVENHETYGSMHSNYSYIPAPDPRLGLGSGVSGASDPPLGSARGATKAPKSGRGEPGSARAKDLPGSGVPPSSQSVSKSRRLVNGDAEEAGTSMKLRPSGGDTVGAVGSESHRDANVHGNLLLLEDDPFARMEMEGLVTTPRSDGDGEGFGRSTPNKPFGSIPRFPGRISGGTSAQSNLGSEPSAGQGCFSCFDMNMDLHSMSLALDNKLFDLPHWGFRADSGFSTIHALDDVSAPLSHVPDNPAAKSPGVRRKRAKRPPQWGVNTWWFGPVLDPRSPPMKSWIRAVCVLQGLSLILVPCFIFTLSYQPDYNCLFVQAEYAIAFSALLTATDIPLLTQSLLSLRMAYVPAQAVALSQVELITNARKIALYNLRLFSGIWLDLLALFPLPQLYVLVIIPPMIQYSSPSYEWSTGGITKTFFILILQYVIRCVYIGRFVARWQRVLGYIFSTAWWGFALNLAAYLTAAHAFGALWYLFAVDRMSQCYQVLCKEVGPSICDPTWITCPHGLAFDTQLLTAQNVAWNQNATLQSTCFQAGNSSLYNFGIYITAVQLTFTDQPIMNIIYANFFGLMTLSSFGNALVPSVEATETTFCVIMIVSGLLLFTLLIGNIQVFLHSVTAQVEAMQLRRGDLTFWMRRRQISKDLKQHITRQERERFLITRGVDEDELLAPLPRTLRREVKRHVCLDLVKKVPLFGAMDDAVLDSICERLDPMAFVEGTEIVRQGEPVDMMVFLVRGHLLSHHVMPSGAATECTVEEGNFTGEELLSWKLSKNPSMDRLPLASATLTTLTVVEAFVLRAEDLSYVVSHFAFKLRSKKLRQLIHFYSPAWRAWAAVTIQLAWRRHMARRKHRQKPVQAGHEAPQLQHKPGGRNVAEDSRPVSSRGLGRATSDIGSSADSANSGSRRAEHAGSGRTALRFYGSILAAPRPHSLSSSLRSFSIAVPHLSRRAFLGSESSADDSLADAEVL